MQGDKGDGGSVVGASCANTIRELAIGVLSFAASCTSAAAETGSAAAVLLDGQRLEAATVVSIDFDGGLRKATLRVDGETVDAAGLTRWGEPVATDRRPALALADGSFVATDRSWSPLGLLRVDADTVRLRRGDGWVEAPRVAVRSILLATDSDTPPTEAAAADEVALMAGDRLSGQVVALSGETLSLSIAGQAIDTPLETVAAIHLQASELPPRSDDRPVCLVGLADGSLVRAASLRVDEEVFRLVTPDGVELKGTAESLALVQPLAGPVRYLSDLEPVDYQQTPYLDLAWPYGRDRGPRGGALVGGGRRAAKGVAMHSAARLVYRLDDAAERFRAELAVADRPKGEAAGSVVFRVYLVRDGRFEAAYESDIVRGGDPAIPIDIDLTDAAALALVVDYADQGDAGDDALWLDARLVSDGR